MTQDTVKKVIKLSQDIRDAKDCLPACRINILAEVLMNKIGSLIFLLEDGCPTTLQCLSPQLRNISTNFNPSLTHYEKII